jgi:NAD-dependent deacetylase
MIEKAMRICETADHLLIIGTSLQVYPAASLMHYVSSNVPIYYVDPRPSIQSNHQITVISENATRGVLKVIQLLKQ